jgi:hypothetical protein
MRGGIIAEETLEERMFVGLKNGLSVCNCSIVLLFVTDSFTFHIEDAPNVHDTIDLVSPDVVPNHKRPGSPPNAKTQSAGVMSRNFHRSSLGRGCWHNRATF